MKSKQKLFVFNPYAERAGWVLLPMGEVMGWSEHDFGEDIGRCFLPITKHPIPISLFQNHGYVIEHFDGREKEYEWVVFPKFCKGRTDVQFKMGYACLNKIEDEIWEHLRNGKRLWYQFNGATQTQVPNPPLQN